MPVLRTEKFTTDDGAEFLRREVYEEFILDGDIDDDCFKLAPEK
jgi:hypothetical protein